MISQRLYKARPCSPDSPGFAGRRRARMLDGCREADAEGVSPGKQAPSGVYPKWEPSAAGRDLLPSAQMSAGFGWDPAGIRDQGSSRGRQGCCLEAAQGSHQGLGSDMGEEGLTWLSLGQRAAAPPLLPLCCSGSFCCHPCKQVLADSQARPSLVRPPHAALPATAVGNEVCPACAIICPASVIICPACAIICLCRHL